MDGLHDRGWGSAPRLGEVVAAAAVVAAATGLGLGLRTWQPDPAAVLVNAAAWGVWIGLGSAAPGFAALNFLFVVPLYTFQVADLTDVLRLVQFPGLAALTGFLAGRLREEAAAAKARARVLAALSDLSQATAEGATRAAVQAQRVAEAERMRAALLSSVSHDLRTPLATILGAASSLRDLGPALSVAAHDDLVAAIAEEAARLAGQVDNLLQMTRLQAGVTLHRVPVDAGEVMEAVRQRAARLFPALRLQGAPGPGPLPLIAAEAQLLEQGLMNLVENAVKFAGTGQPVLLEARVIGDRLALSVTDAGPGIPPDRQGDLFTPFLRGDARPAGFGLGLSIAQGIAAAHGGRLKLESPVAAGRGTRVTLLVPLEVGA
jgi:two-component system sensor histidine kinase KdpD